MKHRSDLRYQTSFLSSLSVTVDTCMAYPCTRKLNKYSLDPPLATTIELTPTRAC